MRSNRHFLIQFACWGVIFALILLQSFTHIIPMKPLKGYDNAVHEDTWEERAKLNTGFREFFIRNYNQVVYSCFRKITNDNIVEGADHELFLQWYLNEWGGIHVHGYLSRP